MHGVDNADPPTTMRAVSLRWLANDYGAWRTKFWGGHRWGCGGDRCCLAPVSSKLVEARRRDGVEKRSRLTQLVDFFYIWWRRDYTDLQFDRPPTRPRFADFRDFSITARNFRADSDSIIDYDSVAMDLSDYKICRRNKLR